MAFLKRHKFKNFRSILGYALFLLALVFSAASPAIAGPTLPQLPNCGPFVRGDVDGNGGVDVWDLVKALKVVNALEPAPDCISALDVNNNERTDIADAVFLMYYLFKDRSAPLGPFPNAGFEAPINSAAAFSRVLDINNNLNDVGFSLVAAYPSTLYIAGISEDGLYKPTPFLVSVDAQGNNPSTRTVSVPTDLRERPILDMKRTPDGGYFLAVLFDTGAGFRSDVFKVDSRGRTIGQNRYRSAVGFVISSLTPLSSTAVLAVGTWGHDPSQRPMVVYINNAASVWEQVYQTQIADGVASIAKNTQDGGYIVAGNSLFTSSLNAGFLWKLNASGVTQWFTTFAFSSSRIYEIKDVIQTTDQGYAAVGTFVDFACVAPQSDVQVVKVNPDGLEQWTHAFGANNSDESAKSITQISPTQLIVSGTQKGTAQVNTDGLMVSISNLGTLQWARRYSSGQGLNAVCDLKSTSDLGFVVVGATRDTVTPLTQNVWILRETATGSFGLPAMIGTAH